MRFPLDDARGYWREVVEPAAKAFYNDNANLPLGLAAVIFLYHLHEKHYKDKFSLHAKATGLRMNAKTANAFELARNLANSGKHSKVSIDTLRQGGFSNDFNDDFARCLKVVDRNGDMIPLDISEL